MARFSPMTLSYYHWINATNGLPVDKDENLMFFQPAIKKVYPATSRTSLCEACDAAPLDMHFWVVLDRSGFVVECSNEYPQYYRVRSSTLPPSNLDLLTTSYLAKLVLYPNPQHQQLWEWDIDRSNPRHFFARIDPIFELRSFEVGQNAITIADLAWTHYDEWRPLKNG